MSSIPSNEDSASANLNEGNVVSRPGLTVHELTSHDLVFFDRLRQTGAFDDSQLQLIEDELRLLAKRRNSCNRVSELKPGDPIGHFVIDELLARGGEGYVFRGHDAISHEPIAIKVLDNVRTSQRFRREMRLVQQLAHPNIVTAYEVSEFHGMLFIAMELLPGPDLNVFVRDHGPLDWLESSRIMHQVARALDHAHQRDLVHRDIKPGNIILSGEGQVKLVDLGLAAMPRALNEIGLFEETKEADVAGTLPYMSPEQAKSLTEANHQSDIYSLGATWFYLLTARTRLPGKSFSEQFSNLLVHRKFNDLPDHCLPPALSKVYRKMVAYDAQDRYASSAKLSASLEQALAIAGELVARDTIHILIVEDSRTDMFRTVEVLRRTNQSLTIHQAATLKQGVEQCLEAKIDLVLLDLNLPDSYGVETVKQFRNAAAEIPIVVLTGTADDETCQACLNSGVSTFLSKVEITAHKMERIIFVTLSRRGLSRIDH